ncbi:MAG: peptide deformylase [Methanomicrobiales archaeon]|nr:peptide deformylase [Methanomicrobiales archaeon]
MPVLPILQIRTGDPARSTAILRTPAREVTDFSPALHSLVADLQDTLHYHGAAGIAAPQAGIPLRLAVVELERGQALVLVNPRITAEGGAVSEAPEACLSLPGICCMVKRPEEIRVSFRDLEAAPETLDVPGTPARIIAHEVDHLEGILCTDRAIRVMPGREP